MVTIHELEAISASHREGKRQLQTRQSHATAFYDIAQLDDDRFAITIHLSYSVGDCRGRGTPFEIFETRQDCVDHFAEQATRFFVGEVSGGCTTLSQVTAQQEMLTLLDGGLFGFVEPAPASIHLH